MNTLYAIRDKKTKNFLHKIVQPSGEYSTGGWTYFTLLPYPEVFSHIPNINRNDIKDWFNKDNQPELEIVIINYTIEKL